LGYLVVARPLRRPEQQFLLRALSQQMGIALANAYTRESVGPPGAVGGEHVARGSVAALEETRRSTAV
jgi:hypothetical protein